MVQPQGVFDKALCAELFSFRSTGVYRRSENLKIFIDVNDVVDLRSHYLDNELVIGANVNLTETMDILSKASNTFGFEYCEHLAKHIDLVANVSVRNVCIHRVTLRARAIMTCI